MLGNIQQVGSSSDSVQTWRRSVLGKCLSLTMGMRCGSLLGFLLCIPSEYMKLPGSLPRFLTSNVFNLETWATFAEAASICCFLLVAHWAGGCWVLVSLALSSSWTLGKLSPHNLSRLVIFPRTPSEKFQLVLERRSSQDEPGLFTT